jgi:hypothetical protein
MGVKTGTRVVENRLLNRILLNLTWTTEIRRLKMRTSVPTDTSIQIYGLLMQKKNSIYPCRATATGVFFCIYNFTT